MNTLVDNMSPAGNTTRRSTFRSGGNHWSVAVLSSCRPLTLCQYTQVIILLTDGLNIQDHWYTTDTDIDAREAMIKAANVELYTHPGQHRRGSDLDVAAERRKQHGQVLPADLG